LSTSQEELETSMVAITFQNAALQIPSLENLLVSYLANTSPGQIPGCDGMTTHQMLRGYANLAERGIVPGCQQLQRWHPELRSQLKRFFRKAIDQTRR
jgi:hypothetical protein